MTEETKNEEMTEEPTPSTFKLDKELVVHVPLSLMARLVEDYAFTAGESLESERVVFGDLFEQLSKEWVIVYRTMDEDGDMALVAKGFDNKDDLSVFLREKYAREIEVDGIEIVLEGGRPRRFKVEVSPRIGF